MKWLKEVIKQDVIAFLSLCFLLGSGLVWVSGHFKLLHLTDGEKVNATVLWLTALAIFWYAYETYQLKKNTSEQVLMQEEIMLNEFLPILAPEVNGRRAVLKNGAFHNLNISNLGKGPAKNIEIQVGEVKFGLGMSLSVGESEAINVQKDSVKEIKLLLVDQPPIVRVRVAYQDIYSRKFQTNNIILDNLSRSSGYVMRTSTWEFKRLKKRSNQN